VVTNPPPGCGAASATFSIWGTYTDAPSSLTFILPPLGATPPQIEDLGSTTYALFVITIAAQNPKYNNSVTTLLRIFALPNPSKLGIQPWFEQNIDDRSGTLLSSGAFQQQQLPNGPAIVDVGPIPVTYQGGPVAHAYVVAPAQDRVYVIVQSNSAQLTEFGYSPEAVAGILTSILGSIH